MKASLQLPNLLSQIISNKPTKISRLLPAVPLATALVLPKLHPESKGMMVPREASADQARTTTATVMVFPRDGNDEGVTWEVLPPTTLPITVPPASLLIPSLFSIIEETTSAVTPTDTGIAVEPDPTVSASMNASALPATRSMASHTSNTAPMSFDWLTTHVTAEPVTTSEVELPDPASKYGWPFRGQPPIVSSDE